MLIQFCNKDLDQVKMLVIHDTRLSDMVGHIMHLAIQCRQSNGKYLGSKFEMIQLYLATVQKAEIEAALLGSKMELSKEVSRLTLESSNKAKELASVYDRRLADMKNELESRHKAAIEAIEDHKAADIQVYLMSVLQSSQAEPLTIKKEEQPTLFCSMASTLMLFASRPQEDVPL